MGALWDLIKGQPKPDAAYTDVGRSFSYDWCRFRRENHCWMSKEIDIPATKLAGYAVWTPQDRGFCPRIKWEDQKVCPIGEPGPHSREPVWYVEATRPYSEGGQHGGVPGPRYRP